MVQHHYTPFTNKHTMWSIGLREIIQYNDLDIWLSNVVQGHCTPLTRRHYAHDISHIGSMEKIYPDKDSTHSMRSDMALTLDLETWFKVTEVLYSKAHWTNWSLSGVCRAGLKWKYAHCTCQSRSFIVLTLSILQTCVLCI